MRFWYDTEFRENGEILDLISIGVVAEDGREYYAVSTEFNRMQAFTHVWLKKNVLPHLPWQYTDPTKGCTWVNCDPDNSKGLWKPRGLIAQELTCFFLNGCRFDNNQHTHYDRFYVENQKGLIDTGLWTDKPELWAYFADYDHVVLCQLFGTMMNLPQGMPMYTRDLKQLSDMLEVPKFTGPKEEHHALADARWNRELHRHIWDYVDEDKEAYFCNLVEFLGERP